MNANVQTLSELMRRVDQATQAHHEDLMICLTQALQSWMYAHALLRKSAIGHECETRDLESLLSHFRLVLDAIDPEQPTNIADQYGKRNHSQASSQALAAVDRELSLLQPSRDDNGTAV